MIGHFHFEALKNDHHSVDCQLSQVSPSDKQLILVSVMAALEIDPIEALIAMLALPDYLEQIETKSAKIGIDVEGLREQLKRGES